MAAINDEVEVALAKFSDRVVAFTVDYLLFAAGFILTLKLINPGVEILFNPNAQVWALVWMGLFLLYHTALSADGRISLGKRLLGLRVITPAGEPLSLPKALLRTLGYIPSSFFGAGFFWCLANPSKRTWHDLMAGSVVVEERPKSGGMRLLIKAGALASIAAFGSLWAWDFTVRDHYDDTMTQAYAYVGISEIQLLQENHYLIHDRFTNDMDVLAELSGDPETFKADMNVLFDPEAGVKISLVGEDYVLTARARDRERTPIRVIGRAKDI